MKRILLLSVVFAAFTANSQSFEIKDDNNNVINGQLVTITGSNAPFTTISGHAKVKNTSSQDLDVKVKRYRIECRAYFTKLFLLVRMLWSNYSWRQAFVSFGNRPTIQSL